ETVPVLARVLVRQGSPDGPQWLALAARHATMADVLEWLGPTRPAHPAPARVTRGPAQARPYSEMLLGRPDPPRTAGMGWAAAGRWRVCVPRRAFPAEPFAGCREPYAAALRGDWRSAADAWLDLGDPYEHAVALAESGHIEPTLEALTILDGLGARPAVAIVRRRLRELGVTPMPPRPPPGTPAHPPRLADRH